MRSVLLAASFPPRNYREHADTHEIAAAVKALLGALFHRGWGLVFGGHPSISTLVLSMAEEYGKADGIVIYQSGYFRNHISPGTRALVERGYGRLRLVDEDPTERAPGPDEIVDPRACPLSLTRMRRQMVGDPTVHALILVGGDTGIGEELTLFLESSSGAVRPILPVGAPGGRARELLHNAVAPGLEDEISQALAASRNYHWLCGKLMDYLSRR